MNYLDEVKSWCEEKVSKWLELNHFGNYSSLFRDNNVNGDILLDCDTELLKELGIQKLSDRVRLLVCIKKLRETCFASIKNADKRTLVIDTQIPKLSSESHSPTDPNMPFKLSYLGSPSSNYYSDTHCTDECCVDSPNNYHSGPSTFSSSTQSPSKDSFFSTLKVSEKSPLSPEINNMYLDSTNQNCVRFIMEKGQTRIVNINHCLTVDAILSKALKEFNIDEDPNDWRVFITHEDGSFECISNETLLTFSSQRSRPERERLILKRKDASLTPEEFKMSQIISKEQQDAIYHTAVMAKTKGNLRKLETFFGEKLTPTLPSSSTTPLHSPSFKDNKSGTTKRIRNFFGQRPPSELISSNLAEYFPGHEKKVLEQTIRNSIRRSAHLNAAKKATLNASNSNTLTYDVTSIPTVGEAWIQFEGQRLSEIGRRFSLSYFISARFPTLLESPLKENNFDSSPRIKPVTESSTSEIKSNFQKELEDKLSPTETFNLDSPYPLDDSLTHSYSNDESSEINRDILDDSIFENSEEIRDFNIEKETENNDSGPTRWIKGALIGSGSFGSVFLGMNALSGELMAVKQAEIPSCDIQGCKRRKVMLDALQREISLLKELHHENIVQYLGSSMDETHLTFFLEYVPGGSVTALLNNYGAFEEPLIRNFVRQILKGLNYLHNKKIIHRDIKGANILVDNKGVIKISDFGISKKIEANLLSIAKNHRPSLQGSVFWMAPEVVKQTLYTRKADIWSLGCLIVEMFTGEHPFPKMNQLQAIFKIGQYASPDIPEHCTIEARCFLEKTFEPDYHARPTAADLLKSSFLGPMVSSPRSSTRK